MHLQPVRVVDAQPQPRHIVVLSFTHHEHPGRLHKTPLRRPASLRGLGGILSVPSRSRVFWGSESCPFIAPDVSNALVGPTREVLISARVMKFE